MAKALKTMLADQLQTELESSSGLMVIDTGSMTVHATEAFRHDLREQAGGATLRIIHNRTAKVALRRLYKTDAEPMEGLDDMLRGENAVVYGGDGPISIAKVVRDWKRKHKKLAVKGAIADGEFMRQEDAVNLADMPDLQQLKGMLAGLVISSGRGIAASLAGVYGGIARCIQAKVDAEGGESESGGDAAE
jgi:large subunit ribosomal protein L10